MKKLTGIIVIILAALICTLGASKIVYSQTVEFTDLNGFNLQINSPNYYEFICTNNLPRYLQYKAKIHVPVGSTYNRFKIQVDYKQQSPTPTSDAFNLCPTPPATYLVDGQELTFTVDTLKMNLNVACGPCNPNPPNPPCNPLMVHVGATFYTGATVSTCSGGSGVGAPNPLDINRTCTNCSTTTTTVQPTTIPTTVPPTTVPPTTTVPQTLIELQSLTAKPCNKSVIIKWQTESEIDNVGFNILRAESADGAYTQINDALIPAEGAATNGASYKFIDSGLENRKTYYYILEDLDVNGTATKHGPVEATPRLWSQCGKYNY